MAPHGKGQVSPVPTCTMEQKASATEQKMGLLRRSATTLVALGVIQELGSKRPGDQRGSVWVFFPTRHGCCPLPLFPESPREPEVYASLQVPPQTAAQAQRHPSPHILTKDVLMLSLPSEARCGSGASWRRRKQDGSIFSLTATANGPPVLGESRERLNGAAGGPRTHTRAQTRPLPHQAGRLCRRLGLPQVSY